MQDALLQGSMVFILVAPLQERILHPAPLTLHQTTHARCDRFAL